MSVPIQELLSACGGDLCSALPWLSLLSADFSYNALKNLDGSLVSVPQRKVPLGVDRGGPWGDHQLFDRYPCVKNLSVLAFSISFSVSYQLSVSST